MVTKTTGLVAKPRKRRVQKRAEETTSRIKDAATRLFSERGYGGTTIRDIENAAAVNRGLVNHHFGTKEKLWKAVLERIFGLLREHLDASTARLNELPPKDHGAHIMSSYVGFNAKHPELTRLMVHESKHDTPRLRFIVDTYSRPLMEQLRNSAETWTDVDQDDFVFWHYTFLGAASLIYTMDPEAKLMFGFDRRSQANVERHADFVANFLLQRGANRRGSGTQQPTSQQTNKK